MSSIPLKAMTSAEDAGHGAAASLLHRTPLGALVHEHSLALTEQMRSVRRHLHRHPELSEKEFETTRFLAEQIRKIGLTPVIAEEGRGLTADVGRGAKRIAIRGDIDALPIDSHSTAEYRSQVSGVMHACGHDAHAAMTMGAISILKRLFEEQKLPLEVAARAVFQPAEETSTGGLHMIRSGALEGIHSAVALHVDPMRNLGHVGVRYGSFTAGCESFETTIKGQAGHGARPHLTGDCVAAMSMWINETYVRAARCHDIRDAVIVNIGQVQAGNAPNVVPSEAYLAGTIRTISQAGRDAVVEAIQKVCHAVQESYPVTTSFSLGRHTPPVNNDTHITAALEHAASEIVGGENIETILLPSMGAEDFAFFADHVPASMFRLGVASGGVKEGQNIAPQGIAAQLHTPDFDIDERALPIGAAILALAAIKLCQGDSTPISSL